MNNSMFVDVAVFSLDLSDPTNIANYIDLGFGPIPLKWGDEVGGILPAAMRAFLNHEPTDGQLDLVISYVQYHIHAPCWLEETPFDTMNKEHAAEIRTLRKRSLKLKTMDETFEYCIDAMKIGLDPL